MKIKTIVISLAALVVGLFGGYILNHQDAGTLASPVGTTFNSAKIAAVTFVPATPSATSTSVYNSDANSRFIESSFSYCTGVGSSTPSVTVFSFAAATSSSATATATSSSNYVMNFTVGTSTAVTANATSTFGSSTWQVWPSATYINFFATATNTASCVVGVHYVAS